MTQPQFNNQAVASDEDVSEEEVLKEAEGQDEKGHRCCRGGAKGLPPRKAIKKLICQELDRHAPEIFGQLIKNKNLFNNNAQQHASQPASVIPTHVNVACDGCGIAPIIGVRYKCCVCQNFDYCEICEDRLGHEHPFIKINDPANAPICIATVLGEEQPSQPEDNSFPEQPRGQEGPHNNWRQFFGGRGRGGQWFGRGQQPEGQEGTFGGRGGNPWARCGNPWSRGGPWGRHGGPHHGGPHHGGPRGNWKEVADHWLNVAKEYVETMTGGAPTEEKKQEEGDNHSGYGKWSHKRAVILNQSNDILEGDLGAYVIAEVEVQNQTQWPWKRNCLLAHILKDDQKIPVQVKDVPIDFEVRGMQTFKLNIPVFISEEAKPNEVYEIELGFYGPRGGNFGQRINLKVKVNEGAFELNLYKAAITMTEGGLGTFDDCVEALRKCNGDENAACQMLLDKNATNQ